MVEIERVISSETAELAIAIKEWTNKIIGKEKLQEIIAEKMVFKAANNGKPFALFIMEQNRKKPEIAFLTITADTANAENEKVELREAIREATKKILENEAIQSIEIQIDASNDKIKFALEKCGFDVKKRMVIMGCSRESLEKKIQDAKVLAAPQDNKGNGSTRKSTGRTRKSPSPKISKLGITRTRILALLYQQGSKDQREISEIAGILPSEANHQINLLIASDLVSINGNQKITLKIENLSSELIQELGKISFNGKDTDKIIEKDGAENVSPARIEAPKCTMEEKIKCAINIISSDPAKTEFLLDYILDGMEKEGKEINVKDDNETNEFLEEIGKICIIFLKDKKHYIKLRPSISSSGEPLRETEKAVVSTPAIKPPKHPRRQEQKNEIVIIDRGPSSREVLLIKKIKDNVKKENFEKAVLEIITDIVEQKPIKAAQLLDICKADQANLKTLVFLLCKEINTKAEEKLIADALIEDINNLENCCIKLNQRFPENDRLTEDDIGLLREIKEEITEPIGEKEAKETIKIEEIVHSKETTKLAIAP